MIWRQPLEQYLYTATAAGEEMPALEDETAFLLSILMGIPFAVWIVAPVAMPT